MPGSLFVGERKSRGLGSIGAPLCLLGERMGEERKLPWICCAGTKDYTQPQTVPQGRVWGDRFWGLPLPPGWGSRAWLEPGQENPGGTHIAGQLLIVFHELLVLLVDGQHLADAIGCCLRLATRKVGRGCSRSALGSKSSHPCSSTWQEGSSQGFESTASSPASASPRWVPRIKGAQREILVAELGAPGKGPEFEANHACWEDTNVMTDTIKMFR